MSPSASAYDGGTFIVWADTRAGESTLAVYGARLALTGLPIDTGGIAIAPAAVSTADKPRTACRSDRCAVTWVESFSVVRAAIVMTVDGSVLPVPVATTGAQPAVVDVASTAEGFLFVDETSGQVHAQRFSVAAVSLGPVLTIGAGSNPSVDGCDPDTGVDALLTYHVGATTLGRQIKTGVVAGAFSIGAGANAAVSCLNTTYGILLNTSGASQGFRATTPNSLQPTPLDFGPASGLPVLRRFDSTKLVAGWLVSGGVQTAFMPMPAGNPTAGPLISTGVVPLQTVALATNGVLGFTAWPELLNKPGDLESDLRSMRFTVAANADAMSEDVTKTGDSHADLSVSWDGARYLVAYQDNAFNTGPGDVHARFVDALGVPSGPVLTLHPGAKPEAIVRTTFDGTNHLVTFVSQRATSTEDLFVTRVSPSGALIEISVDTGTDEISPVASVQVDGGTMLVYSRNFDPSQNDLYVSVLPKTGRASVPRQLIIAPNDQFSPAMAHGANGSMLTWFDANDTTFRSVIVLDDTTLSGAPTGTVFFAPRGEFGAPVIASDGQGYLVVWVDDPGPPVLDMQRFDATGQPVDAAPIALEKSSFLLDSGGRAVAPAVVFDGREYVVTYSVWGARQNDVYRRTVTPTGVVGPRLAFAASGVSEEASALAAGTRGRVLHAFLQYEPPAGADAMRAQVVSWGDVDLGDPCGVSAECRAGQCLLSVCCDPDAGSCFPFDAGAPTVDAGGLGADAGAVDAGSVVVDAGDSTTDAGEDVVADSGILADAGSGSVGLDAGELLADGGGVVQVRYAVGCGCQSADGVMLVALGLWLIRSRRAGRAELGTETERYRSRRAC